MIAIGNGEPCPFCKEMVEQLDELKKHNDDHILQSEIEDEIFTMEQGKDFLQHLMDKHPDEMEKYLFGGESVGM